MIQRSLRLLLELLAGGGDMHVHIPGDVDEVEGQVSTLREMQRDGDLGQKQRTPLGLGVLRMDLRGGVERGLIRWLGTGTQVCRMAHRVLYRV